MSTICDDLRAAILQAAMQGKLTKQLPEDGSAEDLLEEIKAEKEKQIAEGKIKKQKLLAPITDDEIPFSIPENWKWVRMADLFTIVTGKKDANFGSNSGKYRFFTCARTPIYSNSYSFSGESILLAGNGDIGNISYYDGNFEAYQRTYVLQPFVKHTYAKYILRHLMGNWVGYNKDKMFGTAIPYIRLSNVEEYLVAFPPLPEQKRIVEKVDELMARVADLEQSADALASLKKAFPDDFKASLLQAAMQGKLTKQLPEDGSAEDLLEEIKAEKEKQIAEGKIKKQKLLAPITDDEIPFSIPENWKWVRLGDLTALISDGTHKTPKYVGNGVPFLSVQNISKGYFDFTKIKYITKKEHVELTKRIKPLIDDILICRIGTLGKALKNTLDYEFSIFVSLGVVRLIDVRLVDYVIEVINSPVGFKWIQENKVGGGTHTYKINLSDLPNMLIPLPPLAEQVRIVEHLDSLMQNINVVGDLIASE